jgi:hypothetical protein
MNKSCAAALLALIASTAAASAAPQSFYGKTLRVNWTETRSQRDAGETAYKPVSLPFTYTVYVSSKGQLFKRTTSISASRRATGQRDMVGMGGSGPEGAGRVSFQGNTMITTSSHGGLGRQIKITFDGGSSCSAQVISAKSGAGPTSVRSIATGGMVEFESVSAGSASCSVQDGNAFAQ